MIEAYAFFAAFALQIWAMSVLYPTWFIRYWRTRSTSIPAEHFAQVYPGVDVSVAQQRFLTRYRAANIGIVVLGLLLLGWFVSYMRRPDWDDGPVEALVGVYFMVQGALPLLLGAWLGLKFNKLRKASQLEPKRKAVLQRRGLFDFVSPFVVFLAVLSYLLFAAFVFYIRQHPFPGFSGYLTLVFVTVGYALNAIVVYAVLYGTKPNPYETYARRVHTIGLTVKSCVYSSIVCVVFLSLNFTLVLLDLQRWEPFAQSVFLVTCALLCLMGLTAPPRREEAEAAAV